MAKTPGELYREWARLGLDPKLDNQIDVESILMEIRDESRAEVEQGKRAERRGHGIWDPIANLYFASAGLLGFGHVEAIRDVCALIPQVRGTRLFLWPAQSLKMIVPLPDEFSPYPGGADLLNWLDENESRLKWDAVQDKFVLQGSEASAVADSAE